MKIHIHKTVRDQILSDKEIHKIVIQCLKREGRDAEDLYIAIVGDKLIKRLSYEYLNQRHITDVLSFDLSDSGSKAVSGQIIVNAQLAKKKAATLRISPKTELAMYIIHGLLHLIGYDDKKEKEAQKMHSTTLSLLHELGYKDAKPPYLS